MKKTGGQMVVEALAREGVPYLVGIPGHGTLGLSDALIGDDRVRAIQVRHEQAAVHLADAYYRLTGVPLAVFTSIGPGAMNTVIGVASCYVDSVPVLVLTGNSHTHMAGRGVLQEIERAADANSLAVFGPITKRTWRADRVDRLPRILRRAFAEMLTGRRGPVVVDLPMDVQCDAAEVDWLDPEEYRPATGCLPDPELVARAASLLYVAHRPVILAGGGVISAQACAELRALAEFTGAAVITTMMGKGALPEDHPLSAWHAGSKGTTCGNHLAARADVLLAIGTRLADETTSSYRAGASLAIPPTQLIHVDADATEIGKNYPAAVGIAADARATLAAMLDWLRAHHVPKDYATSPYFQEVRQECDAWLATVRQAAASDHVPVTLSRLIAEVRAFLNRDAIVVTSSGNLQAQWFQEAPVYEPGTNLTTGGFSTMGWTVPAALGAKLAAPGRQVLGLVGDGDFLMTVQELATAVQYGLPVVYVVANNAGWIAIRDLQAAVYGPERALGAEFLSQGEPVTPDLAAIARGFGCHAERIERPDQVRPALERAFASGRPAVVEVVVERTYPLSGSPATGWWDVPVPAYLPDLRARYEQERSEEQ